MNSERNYVVVYVDDILDNKLSDSLHKIVERISTELKKCLNDTNIQVVHCDKKINYCDKIEDIVEDQKIKDADILIIDNQLYSQAGPLRVNGDKLSMYLKVQYPFKRMRVITQNDMENAQQQYILKKCIVGSIEYANNYYNDHLYNFIKENIQEMYYVYNCSQYHSMNNTEKDDADFKNVLSIIDDMNNGVTKPYYNFDKEDINNFISEFKKIEELIIKQQESNKDE